MIFMNISSVEATSWLVHVLLQKWISSKSSPSPAQSNFHRWYFVPLWFLKWHTKAQSYSWLKLTGAPWMALVALRIQWWQAHTKYRHFQPIRTQSQHWTPICTLMHLIAQVFAINGKLLAPPGICQLYLFQYNRYLKQTSNGQYPTAFTVYPDLKFMFTWQHSIV